MNSLPRREVLRLGLAAATVGRVPARADNADTADIHQELLALAAGQEKARRARFAAVKTRTELGSLQESLRQAFLGILGGLPARPDRPPTVTTTGRIETEDYLIEKFVFESWPGYYVSALLYKPKNVAGARPGILSPCGHAAVGKAADPYQILHINLAKRGYVVLTYDPVGQGERSQFWDAEKGRSRYNLVCGEHAVLGNALYLLGSSLARFRIWDGLRGLDYLASLMEVDATKIGCVGPLRRRYIDRLPLGTRPADRCGRDRLLHHRVATPDGQPHPGRSRRGPRTRPLRIRERGDRSCRPARAVRASANAAGDGAARLLPDRRGPRIVRRGAGTLQGRRRRRVHRDRGVARQAWPVPAVARGGLRLVRPLAGRSRSSGRRRVRRPASSGCRASRLCRGAGQCDVSFAPPPPPCHG